MVNKDLFIQLKSNAKTVKPLLVLSLASAIIIGGSTILPFQALYAQNITVKIDNTTTGADQVSSGVIANLAKPGYGAKYDVAVKGNTVPINYNIIGGQLVGILADPPRHSLDVAVNPGPNGGAIEIQLPRQTIDSKSATNTDAPFRVVMDGMRISGEPTGICVGTCPNIFNSFKETQNTGTDRVLTIVFGPESRFIEIVGNT
jgi:hypothetical protein